ncbi:hypothetical protein ACOMHN_057623 [Nucella lapillus]
MFSLSQAVNFPTHRDGHTIDWCVLREEELILRSVSRGPSMTSDHMPVMCYLDIAKPASTPVFQTVRNLRAIDKSRQVATSRSFAQTLPLFFTTSRPRRWNSWRHT